MVTNWENSNPIILDGEIIIVEALNGELRFKIGNGADHYIDLPFMDQPLRDYVEEGGNIEAHNTSPTAHANMGWINTEEADLGDVEDFGVNADTLGGIAANQYITETKLTEKGYITESELNSKNYVTSDSLNNYTTISTFNSTIGNIDSILDEINGEVIN